MNRMLFIFLFFSYSAFAQSTDFLLLQKHDRTIATFYSGNHISLTTTSGAFIDADITQLKNDSIFLQQFVVEQMSTTLGVYILDTVNSYHYQYSYKDIKSIVTLERGFDISGSGASLLGGGAILVVASGIVYLADKNNFSPALLIAGAALGTAGYFMSKVGGKTKTIGRKYKLVYVNASSIKR
jgi:hypothetical protein